MTHQLLLLSRHGWATGPWMHPLVLFRVSDVRCGSASRHRLRKSTAYWGRGVSTLFQPFVNGLCGCCYLPRCFEFFNGFNRNHLNRAGGHLHPENNRGFRRLGLLSCTLKAHHGSFNIVLVVSFSSHPPLLPFTCGRPPPPTYTVPTIASELMNTISNLSDLWSFAYDLLVSLVLFAPLYFFLNAIYQLRLSPLSSIPGPWYAAISDFWLFSHAIRLQQCKTIHSLFAQYGPVVRIGPNKVAFCDLSVTKNVYVAHKFDKSDYYKSLLTFVFLINLVLALSNLRL